MSEIICYLKQNCKKLTVCCIIILFNSCNAHFHKKPYEAKASEVWLVPDQITAVKIATAIWLPLIGEDGVKASLPFNVVLKEDSIWVVTSAKHPQFKYGGVAIMELSKRNARVLKIEVEK